jgi:hypothetical protein
MSRGFLFLVIVSGAICLAAVALAVRSYGRPDFITWPTGDREVNLYSADGYLRCGVDSIRYHPTAAWTHDRPIFDATPDEPNHARRFGPIVWVHAAGWIGEWRAVFIPYWLIAALAAPLPLLAIHRRRRPCPGHCPQCGYDLRATPDRCPECGHAPAETAR